MSSSTLFPISRTHHCKTNTGLREEPRREREEQREGKTKDLFVLSFSSLFLSPLAFV